MLKAVFYARFHPERGPDVFFQHPPGSITRSPSASPIPTAQPQPLQSSQSSLNSGKTTLVNFSDVSAYIIPPQELCSRALGVCVGGCRVLGWPVSIEGAQYERNRFVFNVCFVLDEGVEGGLVRVWEGVAAKTAQFFRGLEVEEDGMLKRAEMGGVVGDGLVGRVLREIWEETNEFGECCVRVSDAQVLNLRLWEPADQKKGRKVKDWDVPLFVRGLPNHEVWTWDLVLERIVPHVDGVNHVKRIAILADVDVRLVRKAVRELLRSGFATLLDIFHFQAVYATTHEFVWFVKHAEMLDECRLYVAIDPKDSIFARSTEFQTHRTKDQADPPSRADIVQLYRSLKPGLSISDLCLANQSRIFAIDIRRFITFGVIKGFLRRMHKYALALDPPTLPPAARNSPGSGPVCTAADVDRAWRKAALSSGWATPPADLPAEFIRGTQEGDEDMEWQRDRRLLGLLDGNKPLDGVCVEMGLNEKEVLTRLRSGRFGEVVVFCR